MSKVERLTALILRAVENHGRKEGMMYAEIVRSQTNALVSVNETHRQAESLNAALEAERV